MSTSPRWTWWSSNSLPLLLPFSLVAMCQAGAGWMGEEGKKSGAVPEFLNEFQAGRSDRVRVLPPFLDDFRAESEPPLLFKDVRFPSAVGQVAGLWARPDVKQPLPAVLMVYDEDSWTGWMKTNTRQLASVGYEVLTVNVHQRRAGKPHSAEIDEPTLAELSAAVRWLRRRPNVLPNRLGALGWGWSGGQTLALGSATPLQACIICDAPLPTDLGAIVGLRETPLLGVFAGDDGSRPREALSEFRKKLDAHRIPCKIHLARGARIGFMGPADKKTYNHDAAEDAWLAIYNFLEKHVEDARPAEPAALKPVATIADIMRAVNASSGLRGDLGKSLEHAPGNVKEWRRIRANAALMVEVGGWLQTHPSPKGSAVHWKDEARSFAAAAETIVHAADQRDYAAARRGLQSLAGQCAGCHLEHR